MLFLETVKKICGSNENLYEAILSLYKNDPEHFVFTFCNELDAKVNNAYAAGVLDQIFANDGIQFNVLGASVLCKFSLFAFTSFGNFIKF